jgi:hypothetical protein
MGMDKHWFGLAVLKRAARMLHDSGWPGKILACSVRAGPYVVGNMDYLESVF